ncbi:MAG: hypothetical protein LBP35_02960 [Candidatus Ancillula trichonymphae]|nr:hypothetical protein [Candidatus Ancillula trichonymphae]
MKITVNSILATSTRTNNKRRERLKSSLTVALTLALVVLTSQGNLAVASINGGSESAAPLKYSTTGFFKQRVQF